MAAWSSCFAATSTRNSSNSITAASGWSGLTRGRQRTVALVEIKEPG
jgi:hypothetical protein